MLAPHINMRIRLNVTGISPIAHHTTNKWGFRGDPIPDNINDYYTILTIGGSTTQCFIIDDKKTWSYVLQDKLRAKYNDMIIVQNAGKDGHTTRAHLIMMQHIVPKVQPNIIIFLVGINDLGLSLQSERYYEGSPREKSSLSYRIFSNSRLLQVLWSWVKVLKGEVTLSPEVGDLVLKNLTREESNFSKNFSKDLISLPEFRENLKKIIGLGKQHNISMVFLTQPLLFDDTQEWGNIEGRTAWIVNEKYYLSGRTYAKMLNIYNDNLLEICQETNVECFDLASRVPHSQEYFIDQVHFNDKGNELVAEELYKYLTLNNIISLD